MKLSNEELADAVDGLNIARHLGALPDSKIGKRWKALAQRFQEELDRKGKRCD